MTMQITETTEGSVASKAATNKDGRAQRLEVNSVAEGTRKIRLLIVEDNASDSELTLHALKKGGFESESEVVQTTAEFADRIRKRKYDIILADYRLPGWNGMEP
jgi:PleD family two-component response regulator